MIGANRASIFNPATYKGILDEVFTGETLFAPVMGWNSYQIAFYNSKFKNFIATDVIPDVVENGKLLQVEYTKYCDASIFNPSTYKGILDEVFTGETLFAPVMGWNAYQIAFYNSNFKNFIATDVIPDVVENGKLLHSEYNKFRDASVFVFPEKNIDLYLCPSEQLETKHGFGTKYENSVDAVLLSPPYFDLEIYPSDDQSFNSFPDYQSWLAGYWEETVKLAVKVMKPGAKFGFVISNYVNRQKQMTTISEDMRDVVLKYLTLDKQYRVQWSAISGTRQAKKTRGGNFEDLWVFIK